MQMYDLDHYFTEVKREPIRLRVIMLHHPVLWSPLVVGWALRGYYI